MEIGEIDVVKLKDDREGTVLLVFPGPEYLIEFPDPEEEYVQETIKHHYHFQSPCCSGLSCNGVKK
ncbi:hypothetical protein EFBL_0529 [Effusibacillus lacus]|uniref:Uncharacterized protein n=1 Tax=Effusibacillus lacus TaxID=1348429 RepID=A0A292YKA3_9BACL|nr:hypothetical protein EFBL_0529 [Effusibacillus lacus]